MSLPSWTMCGPHLQRKMLLWRTAPHAGKWKGNYGTWRRKASFTLASKHRSELIPEACHPHCNPPGPGYDDVSFIILGKKISGAMHGRALVCYGVPGYCKRLGQVWAPCTKAQPLAGEQLIWHRRTQTQKCPLPSPPLPGEAQRIVLSTGVLRKGAGSSVPCRE